MHCICINACFLDSLLVCFLTWFVIFLFALLCSLLCCVPLLLSSLFFFDFLAPCCIYSLFTFLYTASLYFIDFLNTWFLTSFLLLSFSYLLSCLLSFLNYWTCSNFFSELTPFRYIVLGYCSSTSLPHGPYHPFVMIILFLLLLRSDLVCIWILFICYVLIIQDLRSCRLLDAMKQVPFNVCIYQICFIIHVWYLTCDYY